MEQIKELCQIFWVTKGRITKEEEETIQRLQAIFGSDIISHLTMVRTNFPKFKNKEVCEEDYDSLRMENAESAHSLMRLNIIHVNNPPMEG